MLQISFITLSGADNISERITFVLLVTSKSLINLLSRRYDEFFGGIKMQPRTIEISLFVNTITLLVKFRSLI